MSMTNASTTFGAVRRPEVAHPRDEVDRGRSPHAVVHHHVIVEAISTRQPDAAGWAMADHIVYTKNAVTHSIPSSKPDAMVSHSANERVA
jgi:DNA-binding GntR family transcriptional regulator